MQQVDAFAVLGHGRPVAQRGVLRLARARGSAPSRRRPLRRSGGGRRCTSPASPSTMMASPGSDQRRSRSRPGRRRRCRARGRRWRRGWWSAPSSSTSAAQPARGRSRAAPPGPCCGRRESRSPAGPRASARRSTRPARAAAGWRDRRGRAAARADTGRSGAACARGVSDWTRSTAASAVRPVVTASRSLRSQPRSWANMR